MRRWVTLMVICKVAAGFREIERNVGLTGELEYVKKVLTRVVAVAGGGSRRVTKEPGGCLHLVINFGIVISGQTSSSAALSCFFFPSPGSLECPSNPPQASSFPGPGASPNRKQPRQHIMWTLKL